MASRRKPTGSTSRQLAVSLEDKITERLLGKTADEAATKETDGDQDESDEESVEERETRVRHFHSQFQKLSTLWFSSSVDRICGTTSIGKTQV